MKVKLLRVEVKKMVDKNKGVRKTASALCVSKECIRKVLSGEFSDISAEEMGLLLRNLPLD